MKLILIVLGVICFAIDAFKVWVLPTVRINFFSLGWALLVAAVLLV